MALDWEFVYNGLTFGAASDTGVLSVEGLNPPDSRIDEVEQAIKHGSFVFAEFLTSRRITMQGDIIGDSNNDFATKINDWRAAFVPRASDLPLVYKFPGEVEKRIYCVPTRRFFPANLNYNLNFTNWTLELLAQDPRIYAEAASQLVGAGVAANAGIFPSFPIATITGATNPVIGNSTTGKEISLTLTMAGGEELIIDFDKRTIELDGVNRYETLNLPTSEWWDLEPGNNTITYSGGGVLTLDWRSAWI